jgi:hypothetical protein
MFLCCLAVAAVAWGYWHVTPSMPVFVVAPELDPEVVLTLATCTKTRDLFEMEPGMHNYCVAQACGAVRNGTLRCPWFGAPAECEWAR